MKTTINFFKSFIGIVFFYLIQFGFTILFYKTLINNNQFINSVIYILIELVLFSLLFLLHKDRLKRDFIDFDKNYKDYFKLGFKIYIIGLLGMIITNYIINMFIFNGGIAYNEEVDRMILFKYPLYATLAIIITGPLNEEIVFRLGFKKYINNKILYYVLATLLFAMVHVINGISNPLQLLYLLPYGSLSLAFTYILDKTDNIFSTIILHSMHNTISVLLILAISFLGV